MKHAYLMIVHNNFEVVEKTIELIDNPENDIYIHVDKKVSDFDLEYFSGIPKYSKVYFTKRIPVYWGHYSQIKSEIILLKAAIKQDYDYYHLISGADLPIKTQIEINNFFEKNKGKEFIAFDQYQKGISEDVIYERIHIYRFFSKYYRNPSKTLTRFAIVLDKIYCKLQRVIRFSRMKKSNVELKKGANWFSITDDLANFIINNEEWIENTFKNTFCGDEIFLQSLVYNSSFMDNVEGYVRSIDWKRGHPYTYRLEDIDDLLASENLFARKFSWEDDSEAVCKIYEYLKYENKNR